MINFKKIIFACLIPVSFCQASDVLEDDYVELPKAQVMALYNGKPDLSFEYKGFTGWIQENSMIALEVGEEFLSHPDNHLVSFHRNWENKYQHHVSDNPPQEIMEKIMNGEIVDWHGRQGVVDLHLVFKRNELSKESAK